MTIKSTKLLVCLTIIKQNICSVCSCAHEGVGKTEKKARQPQKRRPQVHLGKVGILGLINTQCIQWFWLDREGFLQLCTHLDKQLSSHSNHYFSFWTWDRSLISVANTLEEWWWVDMYMIPIGHGGNASSEIGEEKKEKALCVMTITHP